MGSAWEPTSCLSVPVLARRELLAKKEQEKKQAEGQNANGKADGEESVILEYVEAPLPKARLRSARLGLLEIGASRAVVWSVRARPEGACLGLWRVWRLGWRMLDCRARLAAVAVCAGDLGGGCDDGKQADRGFDRGGRRGRGDGRGGCGSGVGEVCDGGHPAGLLPPDGEGRGGEGRGGCGGGGPSEGGAQGGTFAEHKLTRHSRTAAGDHADGGW